MTECESFLPALIPIVNKATKKYHCSLVNETTHTVNTPSTGGIQKHCGFCFKISSILQIIEFRLSLKSNIPAQSRGVPVKSAFGDVYSGMKLTDESLKRKLLL